MSKDISRRLEWSSAKRPKVSKSLGMPIREEGNNGDIQLRQTEYGSKLFAKISGEWVSTFLSSGADVLTIRNKKGAPTISLNADGTASFGSQIDVGSNIKITGHLGLLDFQGANQNICIGNSNNRPMGNLTENEDYSDNTAIGDNTMGIMNQGTNNIAIGNNSMSKMVTGVASNYNVAVGVNALRGQTEQNNTRVHGNTAIGPDAMGSCHDGDSASAYPQWNVAVGRKCLYIVDGEHNVAVGYECGETITTGDNNICIGSSAEPSAATGTNQIVLGEGVIGSGNDTFTFGNGGSDTTCTNGATTWSNPSDQRIKKNITTSLAGLSFINDLNPVIFNYKLKGELEADHPSYEENSTESLQNSKTNHGFIAQEVKETINNHAEIKDGFDGWSINATNNYQRVGQTAFIPMIVKSIQELSAKIDAMQVEINNLKNS